MMIGPALIVIGPLAPHSVQQNPTRAASSTHHHFSFEGSQAASFSDFLHSLKKCNVLLRALQRGVSNVRAKSIPSSKKAKRSTWQSCKTFTTIDQTSVNETQLSTGVPQIISARDKKGQSQIVNYRSQDTGGETS